MLRVPAATPIGVNLYLFAVGCQAREAGNATARMLDRPIAATTLAVVLVWLGAHGR